MTTTDHHSEYEKLKTFLVEKGGYKVLKLYGSEAKAYGCDEYFYKPSDTPAPCLTNRKSPILLIYRHQFESFSSYQVHLKGGNMSFPDEDGNDKVLWVDFQYYALGEQILIDHLMDIERTLIQAWEASRAEDTRYSD